MCNCCNSVNYGNKIFLDNNIRLSCNWINLIDISLFTTNQHLSSFKFDVNEELLKFKVTFVCRNSEKTICLNFVSPPHSSDICQVSNLGPVVLIWKHGTRVLTAGVGAVAMHVKRDDRVSLVGTDLVIVNVTQADAGSYTCELDTDDISPLSVSHQLQILGNIV